MVVNTFYLAFVKKGLLIYPWISMKNTAAKTTFWKSRLHQAQFISLHKNTTRDWIDDDQTLD